ncbi:MAG TPA: glycosyltransferase family 39 protein [Candidatus Thermoplasmatota archaeon]|nr:glycosyltransferase family 39 protein [Candidatus Thermoplasmatota archaeon]
MMEGSSQATEPPATVAQAPLPAEEARHAGGLRSRLLEIACLIAIAAGVALRVATWWTGDIASDGAAYSAMGWAWMKYGEFYLPWGDIAVFGVSPPGWSHHFTPAWPFLLGVAYKAFGFGPETTKSVSIGVSILAVGVLYLCTRNLYGHRAGLALAAVFSLEPHLLWAAAEGWSENLVIALFALTMWSILKSLEKGKEWYIVLGGLFAGLTYLSRSSMGPFFLIAGAGGFAWRFLYLRWAVFKQKWYLAAAVLFMLIFGAWAWRNVSLFGWEEKPFSIPFLWAGTIAWPNWETSSYVTYIYKNAWANQDQFFHALSRKIPFFLGFVAMYALFFLPELRESARVVKQEKESALWLAALLTLVLGWVLASMFWVFEQSSLYWMDNRRYALLAYLPIVWAVVKHAKWDSRRFQGRLVVFLVALLVVSGYVVAFPLKSQDAEAVKLVNERLEEGDSISVEGALTKYTAFPYWKTTNISVYHKCDTYTHEGVTKRCPAPRFILSTLGEWQPKDGGYEWHPKTYPGYTYLGAGHVKDLSGRDWNVYVWESNLTAGKAG